MFGFSAVNDAVSKGSHMVEAQERSAHDDLRGFIR
jgi:hypothetical protein